MTTQNFDLTLISSDKAYLTSSLGNLFGTVRYQILATDTSASGSVYVDTYAGEDTLYTVVNVYVCDSAGNLTFVAGSGDWVASQVQVTIASDVTIPANGGYAIQFTGWSIDGTDSSPVFYSQPLGGYKLLAGTHTFTIARDSSSLYYGNSQSWAPNTLLSTTMTNELSVDASTLQPTSPSPALVQHQTLAVQGAAHATSSSTVTMNGGFTYQNFDVTLAGLGLVVNSGSHALSSTSAALSQYLYYGLSATVNQLLVTRNAAHAVTSSSADVTAGVNHLTVSDGTHAVTSTSIALTGKQTLAIGDAVSSTTSDTVTLFEHLPYAAGDNATHAVTSDTVALVNDLEIRDGFSRHFVQTVTLTTSGTNVFVIDSTNHATSATSANLKQKHVLVTAACYHALRDTGVNVNPPTSRHDSTKYTDFFNLHRITRTRPTTRRTR